MLAIFIYINTNYRYIIFKIKIHTEKYAIASLLVRTRKKVDSSNGIVLYRMEKQQFTQTSLTEVVTSNKNNKLDMI